MRRTLRTTIGVLLSLLLLAWALRGVSFSEVATRIREADALSLTASILVALGGFHFRALRWGVLLSPGFPGVPFRPRLAATYIGFAANNVLPARVGEFARAFTLTRLTRVPVASALATLVIERLLDGLVVVGLLVAAMAAPGFPSAVSVGGVDLRYLAASMAIAMTGLGAGLMFAVLKRERAGKIANFFVRRLPMRARGPTGELLRSFGSGLTVFRTPWPLLASVLLTIAQWVFLATSYLLAFRAFEIDEVPFSGAVFLQSLIALAVAIPSSPGFFGPFEAASREGLRLWGVPEGQSISFAIGYHIAGFLPVTLIGVYYVWRLGLRWSDVRESEESVEEVLHHPAPEGSA